MQCYETSEPARRKAVNNFLAMHYAHSSVPVRVLVRAVHVSVVMYVAIPVLADRVSPVFDVAQTVVLVELDAAREVRRQTVPLHSQDIARRAAELSQYGVNVLICGAVSRPLEELLCAAGIHVIPQTCGPVEEVLQAFATDRLDERAFLMPGCCGGRRRRWRGAGGCGRVGRAPGGRRNRSSEGRGQDRGGR